MDVNPGMDMFTCILLATYQPAHSGVPGGVLYVVHLVLLYY